MYQAKDPVHCEKNEAFDTWKVHLERGCVPEPPVAWPRDERLYETIYECLLDLQLPRFVARYPDTVHSVLRVLWQLVEELEETVTDTSLEEDDDGKTKCQHVTETLFDEFGSIQKVFELEKVFGYHVPFVDQYGLQSGVWNHTGWKFLTLDHPEVILQLKQILKQLGRRSTTESSSTHAFFERKEQENGLIGPQYDTTLSRATIQGLHLSNRLDEMLPSEAVLLLSKTKLRSLFWAKYVQEQLLSYEKAGYLDVPSVAVNVTTTLPSNVGNGNFCIGLDTSYSMDTHESMSKSIVVACVAEAWKQKADISVVAFSSADDIQSRKIETLADLLDFLSYSFRGGTDVTGALRYILNQKVQSDVLLITDGEIPLVKESTRQLAQQSESNIHGILVGRSKDCPALRQICTKVHDVFVGYDLNALQGQTSRARRV